MVAGLANLGRECTRRTGLRRFRDLPALVAIAGLVLVARPAGACTELPAGTSFWVRLTTPVDSYTAKPGMPVRGYLLESPECGDTAILPMKVPVEGEVVSGHRVGWGLRHETAALEIEFLRILPDGSAPIEIRSRVKTIDNAREAVKNGIIRGIRSTDTPQGRISSRLKYLPSFNLYPDPFLLGYKMLFPVFPEPEISLAPGTDIEVELTGSVALPDGLTPGPVLQSLDGVGQLATTLTGLPERTYTKKGKPADLVNVVFSGSRENVEQAFQVAGWKQSDAVSKRAVFRQLYAFLAKTNYETAPMSAQFMEGRRADLTLEKTFDSYDKRNHVRIWELEEEWESQPLWAGAAVRETGATLSIRHKGFIHHVSGDVAEEQRMVTRDLMAGGCVEGVSTIARPDMDRILENATGEFFRTDGSLLVIRLQPCRFDAAQAGFSDAPRPKPGSRLFRYVRRQILTVRSDLLRANCIYAAFDLTRMTVKAFRQNSSRKAAIEAFRHEPVQDVPEPEPTSQLTEFRGP